MIEQYKCIAKNDDGIENIIMLINKIKKHNISYFEGTMRYFTKEHPPFKDSLIYYDYFANDFKFISKHKAAAILVKNWSEYNTYEISWIKERSFCYMSIEPFCIIVSNADFLINNDRDIKRLAVMFYEYITNNCEKEILVWKTILNKNGDVITKKLF